MKYLQLVWADGRPSREDIAVMNRELPAFDEEMKARGVHLFGRELDFPKTAATVRVRGGETLVSDGPFAETKEFIAGFDLLECADLDEAIEVTAKNPISRFHPMELRPLMDEPLMGEAVLAFGRGEDGDARPFLLSTWKAQPSAEPLDDQTVMDDADAWRQHVKAKGLHVMGSGLGAANTATTLRVRGGETLLTEGSFSRIEEFITAIDVVSCTDRDQAIELAATHPSAQYHAIEVRPFYVE